MDSLANYPTFALLSLALSAYTFGLVVYRLFFHPLARFPGPKLAAITRYYEAYYDVIKVGQYTFKIAELHKEYGPIIRISPYELHIADPSFYPKLYNNTDHFDKYDFAYKAFPAPDSTICTISHDLHKRRRAVLNPIFSKPKILANESLVETHVQKLADRIDGFAKTTNSSRAVLNLGVAYTAMTMDIITEYMMGTSTNNLSAEDFNEGMMELIATSGVIWRTAKHAPWILPIFNAIPPWLIKILDEKAYQFASFREICFNHVRDVLSSGQGTTKSAHDDRFVHTVLSSPGLPAAEKSQARLNDELQTIVGAGLVTTAQALRVITFHVYRNPAILHRLRTELSQVQHAAMTSKQLEQLPYLTAIITEALRLSPGLATRQARVSPKTPIEYEKNWTIPPGTPVGMTTLLIHHDERLFPHPKEFDPERWLQDDGDLVKGGEVEKCFAPFGKGTRICLGIHLAWMELYHTVAMLVRRFDFDFVGTEIADVECGNDCFAVGTNGRNGVKVLVRKVEGK